MKLFLPQIVLEEWLASEQADLREEQLCLMEDKALLPLTSAVHFTKVVSGADERKLTNKVKTKDQLAAMSAEQMMDSVILGDDAYEVVSGYVTEVAPPSPKKGTDEASLLAEFLLNKLG